VQVAPMGDYGEKFGFVRTISPFSAFILEGLD
jgi:hypothetical protein